VHDRLEPRRAREGGYRARLVAMVDELQKDERFEVKKVKVGEPASPALIAQAAEAAGGKLPPGVAELFAEMNGFELVWAQVDGFHDDLRVTASQRGTSTSRRFYAPRVAGRVFSDWQGSLYFSDDDRSRARLPRLPLLDWLAVRRPAGHSKVEDFLHDAPLVFKNCKRALFKPKTKAGQHQF
jgi:hypothetical protein